VSQQEKLKWLQIWNSTTFEKESKELLLDPLMKETF
jgi:hypothetical protein